MFQLVKIVRRLLCSDDRHRNDSANCELNKAWNFKEHTVDFSCT